MTKRQIRICIDPGHHGGKAGLDPGAVNGDLKEAVAALAIAKKLGVKLTEKGYIVRFTRNTDKELSLSERCRIANEFNADCFVSIHLNSAVNKAARGVETLRYSKVGALTKELAENVQSGLVEASEMKDRGVKLRDNLHVLKGTKMPAVLVECGFLSNDEEASKLFCADCQDDIAQGIANGIIKTFG